MRCVLIGECMVEMAPTGAAGTYTLGFAGDTFNTAWYLARARPDWQVDYLTAVGEDALSQQFLDFARAAGIGTSVVRRVAGRTLGLYLIAVAEGERSFSYWRNASAARGLADADVDLDRALAGADLILFSGITLAILDAAARGRLLAAVARARTRGAMTAFDPNMRPALWADGAAMLAAIRNGAAVADVVVPSRDEEEAHFGDADAAAICARYAGAGCGTVIVKDGPGPVRFLHRGESGTVPLRAVVRPLDTTAAGDSFNAACLAALKAGEPLEDAILAGAALAARVVQGRGALVGDPD